MSTTSLSGIAGKVPLDKPGQGAAWSRWLEHLAYVLHQRGTDQQKLQFADAMIEYFIESPHQGHPGFETFLSLRGKYRVLQDIAMCIHYGEQG